MKLQQVTRGPEPLVEKVRRPLQAFADSEAAGGIVLLLSIVVALIWANIPFAASNTGLWETELGFRLGNIELSESLLHWMNDGLMAIFFLSVGLEMKREASWCASYQHSNRQRSCWLLPAGACSYPQVSTSSSQHGRLALRFQCSELFLKHVGNDGTLTQQAAHSVLLYSVVDNSAVLAHVDDLVGQITRIIADGIASGEFMVADPVTAGKAVFHATTRLHNPAHARVVRPQHRCILRGRLVSSPVWALGAQALSRSVG